MLLPLCGLMVIEGLLYLYVYPLFSLNALGTWLFFGGSSIAIYVLLFFINRVAGFFTGLLGSALLLLYVIYAFSLHEFAYLYPAYFTLCLVGALMAVVYPRGGTILFTSMFGASTAAFAGLCFGLAGINAEDFAMYGNALVPLEKFLSANATLILGVSLVLMVIGIIVQALATSHAQVFVLQVSMVLPFIEIWLD